MFGEENMVDIKIFDGRKDDVFNALDYFVDELGYELFELFEDEEETDDTYRTKMRERDRASVQKPEDINSGDVLLLLTPFDGEPVALGHDVHDDKVLQCIVSAFGVLFKVEEQTAFTCTVYSLDQSGNRDSFESFISLFKTSMEKVRSNFKDVLFIDATRDEFKAFLKRELNKPGGKEIVLHDAETKEVRRLSQEDMSEDIDLSGLILVGEAQREDESQQIGLVGCEVDESILSEFVVDIVSSYGFDIYRNDKPEIIRVDYKDGMIN